MLWIAFSPDGRTLAIARGARDAAQRDGRIELWDTTSGQLRHTITGFDGPVWSVSFSPDGKTLISGSTEFRATKIQSKARAREGEVFAELKWWDAQSGEFKRKVTVAGKDRHSLFVAYAPDGNSIATVERYSETSLAVSEGPMFDSRIGRPSTPYQIGFSMSEGVTLKLVDAETGEVKRKVKGGSKTYTRFVGGRFSGVQPFRTAGWAEHAVFSPDGQILAVVVGDEVKLWDARTGEELRTLKKFFGRPGAIAFSPDSRLLAVSSGKGRFIGNVGFLPESELALIDISTGNVIHKLKGNNDSMMSLAFTPNGRAVLIGSLQQGSERKFGTVKLWDLKTERLLSFSVHDDEPVTTMAFMPNARALAIQSGSSSVELWDTVTWKVKYSFVGDRDDASKAKAASRFLLSVKQVLAIAFSPDGKTVSGEIPEEGFKLWDPRTGELKQQIAGISDATSISAIAADGKTLAEVHNKALRLWDLQNKTSTTLALSDNNPVSSIALSFDGRILAIASNQEITLRSTSGEEKTLALAGHRSNVSHLFFSSDSRTLLSVDEEGTIKSWDVATGKLRNTLVTGGKVTAIGLTSGQQLATAGEDYSVSLWNPQTGALLQKLKKHDNIVNALAFSSDGALLASGGDDRTVIIWDTASGKSRRTLKGHDLTVTSLAFSPDASLIASGSGNASVVLWNVQTGKLDRILR